MIGFLQGDGSLSGGTGNKGKLTFEISARDKQIVDLIRSFDWPCYVGQINRVRNTNFSNDCTFIGLSIYSKNFRDSISKYIPVGRKSEIITPPDDIPKEYIHHYLRGFFDADGSIGLTGQNIPFISFTTASERIKLFIVNDIKMVVGVEKRINRNERDNIFNITLFREDAVEYANRLYKDSSIYIERKFQKYIGIQQ